MIFNNYDLTTRLRVCLYPHVCMVHAGVFCLSCIKCLLLQYNVPRSGLEKRTLCLSVWNDSFRRNKFLGQVLVPLSKLDLSRRQDRWMLLSDCHQE